ncbi:MAG: caspase family protein [Phormidesmis sp.]
MRNVYALLVGIDEYDERLSIPALKGCVNDIQRMQTYLKGRISKEVTVHVHKLTNEQATRQNIINGFRQHLSQAKNGDTALFYYAGYGARGIVPEAWRTAAAPHSVKTRISALTETLVCYDSRVEKGAENEATHFENHKNGPQPSTHPQGISWDLAGPELTQLLAETSQTQAHVVAILDARETKPDLRPRPLSSFISPSQSHASRYILMRASSLEEQAQEYFSNTQPNRTQPSGAFSHFLYKSLTAANGSPSYQDLFKRTNALIRSSLPTQSPQIIATHAEDLTLPFLGEEALSLHKGNAHATAPTAFTVRHDATKGWIMNGGAVHGLPASVGSEKTTIALFPQGTSAEQMAHPNTAIANARLLRVHPRLSAVKSPHLTAKNKKEIFKAVVTNLAIPPLLVHIEGNAAAINSLQRAIATAGPGHQPSRYVQLTDLPENASLHVLAEHDIYTLTAPPATAISGTAIPDIAATGLSTRPTARPLTEPILGGTDATSAARMASTLEHIARWKTIVELASPADTSIRGTVELKLYTGDEANKDHATEITTEQIRLVYKSGPAENNQAQTPAQIPPRFRIKLHNTSHQSLYCSLFYLTERFKAAAVKPDKINSIVQLAPGEEMWFADGLPLFGTVPDELWRQGITECQDMMKLVACTQPFDPTLLNLGPLGTPIGAPIEANTANSEHVASGLNQLMQRIIHREIPTQEMVPPASWITNQIAFTFVRSPLPVPLTNLTPVSISTNAPSGPNVTLQPHPKLTATAQLTTAAQAARTFGLAAVSSLLHTHPFCFSISRNSAPGLSVLQLTNLQNVEAVTADQPLRLETNMPLGEDEYILPVAYDGDTYLPLGYGKTDQGKTHIVIERLPIFSGPKSLLESPDMGKAICIIFQTVKASHLAARLSKRYGQAVSYPLLSAAHVNPAGEVNYTQNAEAIAFKVKQAKAIALYLPGPFNDTETDLPHLNKAFIAADQPYDLLLTFDYDTFNTSLEQNAESLAQSLSAIGLSANHGKRLHLIAHSTSGLIARWFIEQAGGNAVVDHLFMLGGPNAGIDQAHVQSGTTAAIALTLNGLSHLPDPRHTIGNLFHFNFFRLTTAQEASLYITNNATLEQSQPKSTYIKRLLASPDPNIPYTLINGKTSHNAPHRDQAPTPQHSVLKKLNSPATAPFYDQAHDLMVSADSMAALPDAWNTPNEKFAIACHHLEYLTHPESISTLSQAIANASKPAKQNIPSISPGISTQTPKPLAIIASGAIASTSAGIAAASDTMIHTQNSIPKISANTDPNPMHEPPESQPSKPQNPETQNPETQNPEPQNSRPQNSEPQPQPPISQPPETLRPEQEPAEVYAPSYAPSPEAKSSPLAWVWVLFTAVLAGLVAFGWIQYFNSPITPSEPDTETTPNSSESGLPALPDSTTPKTPDQEEAPIAPGGET